MDLIADLRRLGDEGWELIELPNGFLGQRSVTVTVRRAASVPSEPASWEYRLFETANVPPQWWDHIRSYGWTILDPSSVEQHTGGAQPARRIQVAKRPGWCRGTDDGDIAACLGKLGYVGGRMQEVIAEVLTIKWELSQQQGHDVGTSAAAQHWLVHRCLPTLWA